MVKSVSFESFVIGMFKNVFEGQGYLHSVAFMQSRGKYDFEQVVIGERASDVDAAAKFRQTARASSHEWCAVGYEATKVGGEASLKADKRGKVALDVVRVAPQLADELAEGPDRVVFVVLSSRRDRSKILLLPVIGEKRLGAPVDVTGDMESPFADCFSDEVPGWED